MFLSDSENQTIIENSQSVFLDAATESFLIDRKSAGLSPHTIEFYRNYLRQFCAHCDANALKLVRDVSADLLRRYFLLFAEKHNPGGVHCSFRTLRAFFRWLLDEEIMPDAWKNPMLKVRPPKVNLPPLEPVSLEDVKALIETCPHVTYAGIRDKAICLFLMDTGMRSSAGISSFAVPQNCLL